MKHITVVVLLLLAFGPAVYGQPSIAAIPPAIPDSIAPLHGTYAEIRAENWWLTRLRNHTLNASDTTVIYPKFLNFCIKAYRWADRVFNSHDTTYVRSDGRNWKVFLASDNWADAYSFGTRNETPPIRMMSELYANLGIKVKYHSLSVGYSVDMNAIFSDNKSRHEKWDFSFGCALFDFELHLWQNDGGTYIRKFGDFNDGRLIRKHFDGIRFNALQAMAYYYFNHRKFSMGAAHGFANNQVKSAGSALAGFDFSAYRVDFDFTQLPRELIDYYDYPLDEYRFHYQSYKLIGGYSYNWVANRHLVLNITMLPGIGITNSYDDSSYGKDILFSFGGKGSAAISYSHRKFFCGLAASITLNSFVSDNVDFFSAIQNYQAAVGIKF